MQVSVLARLLSPSDYGLMAIIAVVLSIGTIFSDLGLSSAYLQRRDVTPDQRSSLYWASVATGAMATALTIVASPYLAAFFVDQRLTQLIALSASVFFIGSLSQQLRITAQKQLNFGRLVVLESSSIFTGFLVSLYLALNDFGVYALVWGTITSSVATTLLSWLLLAAGWRPRSFIRFEDIRTFLKFGGATVGNNLVSQVNMNLDLLIGGRMLDAPSLGLMSVPRNLMLQLQLLVNPVITRVGFPVFAEIQYDIPRVRNVYLKTVNMTSSFNAPVYIATAFFSGEIVKILLGENWSEAGEILRILAIWGYLRSIANPVGSLLLGLGRPGLSLTWNAGVAIVSAPILWYSSTYGSEGLAWGLTGLQLMLFVPVWRLLVHPLCGAGLLEYMRASLLPGVFSCTALFPAWLIAGSIDNEIIKLVVACALSIPTYLIFTYVWNRSWFDSVKDLLHMKAH